MTEVQKIGELETVPQNLFGVSPVDRPRPYLGDLASRESYMKFLGYERGVLTARIAELNSRADQILYIYLCRINKAYLAVADRSITTARPDDSYFYDWLDELYIQGVAYAARRPSLNTGKATYKWDEIQKVIDLCLAKGLDLETAAKVASVGVRAVEKYLRHGVISLDNRREIRAVGADTLPPDDRELVDEIDQEQQADILKELAEATSSRGASMMARDRIGTDFARISAIHHEKDSELPGFIRYSIEVQIVKLPNGDYTPYEARLYFEESTPIKVIKFTLTKLSESLSRIL